MSGPLAGVRALLLDLDGVLVVRGRLLPGALESLARLDAAGFPYLIGTNMSLVSRRTLVAQMARGGFAVPVERVMTASSAAAAYCARAFAGEPIFVMAAPDALREFEGQRVLGYDEAASADSVAAVVVGDAAQDFTARNMQSAFRLIREGAHLVAMHKNRWWITPEGVRLDSGAYVTALEFGTERRALVTGKPSRAFFREAVRCLDAMSGHSDAGPLE
jgi:HAD superfamily hydrolase (TIGR01450 family)